MLKWLFILIFSKIQSSNRRRNNKHTEFVTLTVDDGAWDCWNYGSVAVWLQRDEAIMQQFSISSVTSLDLPLVTGHVCHVSRVLISRNVWSGNCRQITQALELPPTAGEGWLVTCSLSHLHSLVTRKWVKIPLSTDRASTEVTLTWCKPNECNNEQFHCLDNSCSNRIIPLPSSICILRNAVYWRYVASCNSMTLAK